MDFLRRFTGQRTPTHSRHYPEEDYELLPADVESDPSHSPSPHPNSYSTTSHRRVPTRKRLKRLLHLCVCTCTPRRLFLLLLAVPLLVVLGILASGVPPLYRDVRAYEQGLPQHRWDLVTEGPAEHGEGSSEDRGDVGDGGEGYLWFPDHLWGHGLNNVLQEYLLTSHIALVANRSFVFNDYVWSHLPFPYTIYDFALRQTRIPLNAFISGPTAGGPMDSLSASPSSSSSSPQTSASIPPRAVSAAYFTSVCPLKAQISITATEAPRDQDGRVLVEWWKERLERVKGKRCVVVHEGEEDGERVVDKFFFGSPRLHSLYPALAASPILRDFAWSPLVHSTLLRNFALIQPPSVASLLLPPGPLPAATAPGTSTSGSDEASANIPSTNSNSNTLSGLVAVHIRRGDYKRHCARLAGWGSTYLGLNTYVGLIDRFDPEGWNVTADGSDSDQHQNQNPTERKLAHYLLHCLPTPTQITTRLHTIRAENPDLRRVYLLTNAWGFWIAQLERELKADGWVNLRSTGDLVLDAEQAGVGAAVDMALAERAEVFVGNGFSSLTANIVMLRMAKGLNVASNRFL